MIINKQTKKQTNKQCGILNINIVYYIVYSIVLCVHFFQTTWKRVKSQ